MLPRPLHPHRGGQVQARSGPGCAVRVRVSVRGALCLWFHHSPGSFPAERSVTLASRWGVRGGAPRVSGEPAAVSPAGVCGWKRARLGATDSGCEGLISPLLVEAMEAEC